MVHRLTDLLALPSADPTTVKQYWRWQGWDSLFLASSNLLFNLLQPSECCQGQSVTFSSFLTISSFARPSSSLAGCSINSTTPSMSQAFSVLLLIHLTGAFCFSLTLSPIYPLILSGLHCHLLNALLSSLVRVLNKPPIK